MGDRPHGKINFSLRGPKPPPLRYNQESSLFRDPLSHTDERRRLTCFGLFASLMADDELKPLPPRQMRFVEEYVKDLNGGAAAIRAGYSSHTASSIASEYLARPEIAQWVERAKAIRLSRTHYEADTVLQEMATLAHSDVSHYALDENDQVILAPGAPSDAMKAIKKIKRKIKRFDSRNGNPGWTEVDVEIELWDKPGPLKLMGRHVGIFPDRVEVTGKDGAPLSSLTDQELAERAAKIAALARGMAEDK